MKDFYYILGLESNCTLDEIKDAYRKLSKKLHPDLNQGDKYFENRFKDIKEAWETLRDPVKKRAYDQDLIKYRANLSGQQAKRQEYYRQSTYQARPAGATVKPKRKGPGVGMTIVFILMALILGDYLVRTFNPPKKTITIKATPDEVVTVVKAPTHHKKKHSPKNKNASASEQIYADNAEKTPVQQASFIEKPVEPKAIVKKAAAKSDDAPAITDHQPKVILVKKPIAAVVAKPETPLQNKKKVEAPDLTNYQPSNSSYSTYVKPNPTGVVNMREFDSFGSVIVQTIPANARVVVLAKGNTYYRVSFNNVVGYVPRWALQAK